MTTTNARRVVAVGLAVLMVAGALSGAAAAAPPTTDTSSTDETSTTSTYVNGYTVSNYTANASKTDYLEFEVDSTNPKVEFKQNGTVLASYEASALNQTASNATAGTYHYGKDVPRTVWAAAEVGANEQTNVTVTLINNTNVSNPDTTNFTVTIDNTGERAVVRIDPSEVGENSAATVTNESSFLGIWETKEATAGKDNVAIDGSNTTVYMVYNDKNVSGMYDEALDDHPMLLKQETESKDRIHDHVLKADGTYYASYNKEAPEKVLDASGATYGVYEDVSGMDATRIELGEDFEGETSLDVTTKGNQTPGFTASVQTYGDEGWFSMSTVTVPGATAPAAPA